MGDDALGVSALGTSGLKRKNYSKLNVLDCPEGCSCFSSEIASSDEKEDMVVGYVRTANADELRRATPQLRSLKGSASRLH